MIFDSDLFMFKKNGLDKKDIENFYNYSMYLRSEITELVHHAGSGHIGGSFSTIDALLMTYICGNLSPQNADTPSRDRVIVSHGHISPAVYCTLSAMGYINRDTLFSEYRRIPGKYEGHPSIAAKGVDWGSGSLGQGLSVGCGTALAAKLNHDSYRSFVFLGDGENDKGQLTEAMALASKYSLHSVIAFIDFNGLQCSGSIDDVLPLDLDARYKAYGWQVFHVDGHDFSQLYQAFKTAYYGKDRPSVIIGKTVMGKGLPFIENNCRYHGSLLNTSQLAEARKIFTPYSHFGNIEISKKIEDISVPVINKESIIKNNRVYSEPIAPRSTISPTFMDLLASLPESRRPIVIDCDVAPSTGTGDYIKAYPENSVECGIAENNAATIAGAMSNCGMNIFFSTFGSFAFGEPYGQLRSCTMNHVPIKVIATHCGLDVGLDGKTHQCIDYIGLAANMYHFPIMVPGDGNQMGLAIRYLASIDKAGSIATGRSVLPIIKKDDGSIFYDEDFVFEYGKADWIRQGGKMTVITYGTLLHTAVEVSDELRLEGIHCNVLNICCPLKLDEEAIKEAASLGPIIIFEDHNARTGLGSLVALFMSENNIHTPMIEMGLHEYGGSASSSDLYHLYHLDAKALTCKIKEIL